MRSQLGEEAVLMRKKAGPWTQITKKAVSVNRKRKTLCRGWEHKTRGRPPVMVSGECAK